MIYLITNYQNNETKFVRVPLHPTPTPPHNNLWFKISTFVLQNFRILPDKLGTTKIADLSSADMNQIKSLALIELTSLMERNNVIFQRRKGKKKAKGSSLSLSLSVSVSLSLLLAKLALSYET